MQPGGAGQGGQGGQGGAGVGGGQGHGQGMKVEDNNVRNQYSIPGIVHFIQHEWARFEMERSQWEVKEVQELEGVRDTAKG